MKRCRAIISSGAQLSASPDEDHWTLRNQAAVLLADICLKYADDSEGLLPRMVRTLQKNLLGPGTTLPMNYGAIVAISCLGAPSINHLFLQPAAQSSGTSSADSACTLVSLSAPSSPFCPMVWVPPGCVKGLKGHEGAQVQIFHQQLTHPLQVG